MSKSLKTAAVVTLLALAWTAHADGIDEYVRAQLAKNHIPALSLAVVRDGKVEKLRSYGVANLEWDAPATDDTRYQLASATKPFTGTLLMQLVEQGKLALDDGVAKYLPEAPESWRAITVRHLGAHTSGIKEVDAGKLATVDAIVAAAVREPLAYEPGTRSTYGFTDYVVLARIMEKVSGKPFADLLRDGLTAPLGMTATGFDYAAADGPIRTAHVLTRRAEVYRWDGGAQRAELVRTLEEMGPIVIGMRDPVRALELVEERRADGRWTRKYRVMFGRAATYWQFDLTAEGKIISMRPASE